MNKIIEIKNNSGKIIVSTNNNELIIGRDCFVNCQDKRISREHACIKYVDGTYFIVSLHSNPLFYKAKNTDNIVIIAKDVEREVNNEDKISLIPNHDCDDNWLNINIVDGETSSNVNKRKLPSWLGNDIVNKKTKNTANGDEIDKNCNISTSSLHTVRTQSKQNVEAIDIDNPTDAESKILIGVIKQEPIDDVQSSSNTNDNPVPSSSNTNDNPVPSSSNTNDNPVPSSANTRDNPVPSSSNANIGSSANEEPLRVPKIELNNESVQSSTVDQPSLSNRHSPVDVKNVKKEEPDSSSSNLRDSCSYGVNCYRSNPLHRTEMAHPGDDDYRRPYFPDPAPNAPDCPFGARCYRRNPVHFQQFKHPSSTSSNNNSNVRKRRRNIISYNEDGSENDSEDLFINDDSSDDYVPSDTDEDNNSEHEISQIEI